MSNRQDSGQSQSELKSTAVGVGLRPEHYQDVLEQAPSIDFLEVHSENFFADAGISVDLLQEVSASTPISLHGTSAGLGPGQGSVEGFFTVVIFYPFPIPKTACCMQ